MSRPATSRLKVNPPLGRRPSLEFRRLDEAKAFLLGARHLRNLSPHGLSCQFNLKPETAATLLAIEQQRRVGGDG